MPAPTPGAKVVGAAMVAADVRSDLDGFRSFVNGDTGLSASDVTAASIRKEQVYRPEHLGFPVSGSEGATQAVYSVNKIPDRPTLSNDWVEIVQRTSVFRRHMKDGTSTIVPWLAKTIALPQSSWVRATATFNARPVYDSGDATNPEHVTGSTGTAALGGTFELMYRSRTTGVETSLGAIRAQNNPYTTPGASAVRLERYFFGTSWAATLPAGTYDIYVRYSNTTPAISGAYQISFSATNLLIEADF